MNREIEFRGKNRYGAWIYGDLIQKDAATLIMERGKGLATVDKDSVGQYLNRKDKHGKKAYEGDIVKYGGCGHEEGTTGVIEYKTEYMTFDVANCFDIDIVENFETACEIIGNAYDNPDLVTDDFTLVDYEPDMDDDDSDDIADNIIDINHFARR